MVTAKSFHCAHVPRDSGRQFILEGGRSGYYRRLYIDQAVPFFPITRLNRSPECKSHSLSLFILPLDAQPNPHTLSSESFLLPLPHTPGNHGNPFSPLLSTDQIFRTLAVINFLVQEKIKKIKNICLKKKKEKRRTK
jgi:hypothetical protein